MNRERVRRFCAWLQPDIHSLRFWAGIIVAMVIVYSAALLWLASSVAGAESRTAQRQCEASVMARADSRAAWQRAREHLLGITQNPTAINSLIDDVLEAIPPLECVNRVPKTVDP